MDRAFPRSVRATAGVLAGTSRATGAAIGDDDVFARLRRLDQRRKAVLGLEDLQLHGFAANVN